MKKNDFDQYIEEQKSLKSALMKTLYDLNTDNTDLTPEENIAETLDEQNRTKPNKTKLLEKLKLWKTQEK